MALYAHITGWGMKVPERVMTNDDLAQMVDTNDEWIQSRTGVVERRIAAPDETTATLAVEATLKALDMADLKPSDVDMIIVSTSSPEHTFPATASIVQDTIGAVNAGAFDLSAACTGFIYGLDLASQSIRSGSIENAVVIGAETLSRLVNWEDRNTCILFGDGAGAFVLQACEEKGGYLSSVLRSDGSGRDLLSLPAGGSKMPASMDTVTQGLHFIQMNGREVFRFATRVMARATTEAVEKAGLELDSVRMVIPHQANKRIIRTAAKKLKMPNERFYMNLDRYGNTSTASIPLAACEAFEEGLFEKGDKVVFVGFGGGLTWGAAAFEWSGPLPDRRSVRPSRYLLIFRLRSLLRRIKRILEGWIWGRKS